jgi:hypothetical protein
MNPRRRPLSFSNLSEVMPDVDRALRGYDKVGNWSLGQVCNHISGALRFTVEGYPARAPWLVRVTIAPLVFRRVMKTGQMPENARVPDVFLPKPALDDRAEAEALRGAIQLYVEHTEPMALHPFFGKMTRSQWDRFHCIHAAHHLSFLLPQAHA